MAGMTDEESVRYVDVWSQFLASPVFIVEYAIVLAIGRLR
jgi:hypothetical protein